MYNFRTDLADERTNIFKKNNNIVEENIDGIETNIRNNETVMDIGKAGYLSSQLTIPICFSISPVLSHKYQLSAFKKIVF